MIQHALRFLPLAALALAGCASDRVVVDDIGIRYSRAELPAAADGRDLRTAIQGNPFGTPGFDQAVLGVMNRTYVGPKTNFTGTPRPDGQARLFRLGGVQPVPGRHALRTVQQRPDPDRSAEPGPDHRPGRLLHHRRRGHGRHRLCQQRRRGRTT